MTPSELRKFGLITAINVAIDGALRNVMGGCFSKSSDCEHGDCHCSDAAMDITGVAYRAVLAFHDARTKEIQNDALEEAARKLEAEDHHWGPAIAAALRAMKEG